MVHQCPGVHWQFGLGESLTQMGVDSLVEGLADDGRGGGHTGCDFDDEWRMVIRMVND